MQPVARAHVRAFHILEKETKALLVRQRLEGPLGHCGRFPRGVDRLGDAAGVAGLLGDAEEGTEVVMCHEFVLDSGAQMLSGRRR